MASILKLGPRWRALIRRKGHKSICKTHLTKAAAEAWARMVEADLDGGRSVAALWGVKVGELNSATTNTSKATTSARNGAAIASDVV